MPQVDFAAIPPLRNGRRRRCFGRDDTRPTLATGVAEIEPGWRTGVELRFGGGCCNRKSGGKPPHSTDMETCDEDGLVRGLRFGMIWAFLQVGAHQRRAPCGTQPSPKS